MPFEQGFPPELAQDVRTALAVIPAKTYGRVTVGTSEQQVAYVQQGRPVLFPYRLYFLEPGEGGAVNLTKAQRQILHCVYTRSCNGFAREKHVMALLEGEPYAWTIPYIVKLCDEYVVEILEVIHRGMGAVDARQRKAFCRENRDALYKSYDRMVSYWDVYYRGRYPRLQEYVGSRIFREYLAYYPFGQACRRPYSG